MKSLEKLSSFSDHLIEFLFLGACGLLVITLLLTSADVIMRYFFNNPIIGAGEISENCLFFMTFLSTAWLQKREKHINIDLLVVHLKPRTRAVVNSIVSIACALICLIITWYGGEVTWREFQNNEHFSTLLGLPKAPIHIFIPVGCFLLFIQFLLKTYEFLASRQHLRVE